MAENSERRHPMQVFVAVLCTASGIPLLLGGPQPGSLSESLPSWLVHVWAAVLVTGGALLVSAAIVRDKVTALFLELTASPPLALVLSAYASGALFIAGWKAVVPVGLLAGLAAAFLLRAAKVYRQIRELRAELGRRE
jgi:hypothetical protein